MSDPLQPPLPPPAKGSALPQTPPPAKPAKPSGTPQVSSYTDPVSGVARAFGVPQTVTQNLIGQAQKKLLPSTVPQAAPAAQHITGAATSIAGASPPPAPLTQSKDWLTSHLAKSEAPPLSYLTHHLGSLKGPADKALGFVRDNLQGDGGPQMFGALAGLASPILKPIVGTPFGAPLIAGLYGALRGGESFAAVERLFRPAMSRLGLDVKSLVGGASPPTAPTPSNVEVAPGTATVTGG
jgi:hypothetical protein